jgi:hypothetical protein
MVEDVATQHKTERRIMKRKTQSVGAHEGRLHTHSLREADLSLEKVDSYYAYPWAASLKNIGDVATLAAAHLEDVAARLDRETV